MFRISMTVSFKHREIEFYQNLYINHQAHGNREEKLQKLGKIWKGRISALDILLLRQGETPSKSPAKSWRF